ncbi:unnamed protein product [Cuscuta epithymum]|uniref:Uncharacterized protein n=1 Tax=Cuscuta epithymum TaxID=186058 RepID=A0AAV0FNM6_9ASTE|nr:unnamed protein product [Cuscuta epithymum]
MALHLWELRRFVKDAVLPVALPLLLPAADMSTRTVQEVNEKIQRGMVGIFISCNGDGDCVNEVRPGSEEHRSAHPNAHSVRTLGHGVAYSAVLHCAQCQFASSFS